jgi:hypothetical protein
LECDSALGGSTNTAHPVLAFDGGIFHLTGVAYRAGPVFVTRGISPVPGFARTAGAEGVSQIATVNAGLLELGEEISSTGKGDITESGREALRARHASAGDVHHRPGAVALMRFEDHRAPVHDGLGQRLASSQTRSSALRPR